MQGYSEQLAHLYHLKLERFAAQFAPRIFKFYDTIPFSQESPSLLDVGCGTGILALYFLERGYRVTGIDLSAPMLDYAKKRTEQYLDTGQAQFIHADATTFTLPEQFGLVTATFNMLNHFENEEALTTCFERIYAVTSGYFVADLNTKVGMQRWNNLHVEEDKESVFIRRGMYHDEMDRAWSKVSGFIRNDTGHYERFDETVFNTPFAIDTVKDILMRVGWSEVYFARPSDLSTPITEPELEMDVFIIAKK